MPKIVVLVDTDGKSQVITKGIAGSACLDKSEFVENALGTVTSVTRTEEYDGLALFTDDESTTSVSSTSRAVNRVMS